VTFPVLVALGYPPITANVSNTIGLVPGSLAGAAGYRQELTGFGRSVIRLVPISAAGGIAGALLLLALPASSFAVVVPFLVAGALGLVVLQPFLARRVAHAAEASPPGFAITPSLALLLLGAAVYGGYFGAAQGIVLLGVLGALLAVTLHEINAVKNLLAGVTNCVAGIVFAFGATVDWRVAGLIGGTSLCGGLLGASIARRLPAQALRGLIVCVGVVAVAKLVL
jgi:uncharacterized protein